MNDMRDEGVNEIIGFRDNLDHHALEQQISNELSNSLIINAEELRQLHVQTQGMMQAEKAEKERMRQITVDVADVLYPFVKSTIHKMGWLSMDQASPDGKMQDGSEKLGDDLVWSD